MRDVELKLTGTQNSGEIVVCFDDKPVNFKKNEFGSLICKYHTENNKVNIKAFGMLDVGGIVWFITQIFFFLISVFGIFDIHRKEKCMVFNFETEVDLKEENKITLQLNSPQENGQAIDVQTDLTNREISNRYYLDTKAKKTLKILRLTKIFLTLAIVITAIAVLMIKL